MNFKESLKRTGQAETAAFFYKPETKFPARIYILFEYEDWQKSKTRPLCLVDAIPFLKRPMNDYEKGYMSDKPYLSFFSFSEWSELEKHISTFHGPKDQAEIERLKQLFPLTNKVNLYEQRKQFIECAGKKVRFHSVGSRSRRQAYSRS